MRGGGPQGSRSFALNCMSLVEKAQSNSRASSSSSSRRSSLQSPCDLRTLGENSSVGLVCSLAVFVGLK